MMLLLGLLCVFVVVSVGKMPKAIFTVYMSSVQYSVLLGSVLQGFLRRSCGILIKCSRSYLWKQSFLRSWCCQAPQRGLFMSFLHNVLLQRQIKKVAVIGGGLMGSGIATALILSNIPVVLKEVDPNFLQRGQKMIAANLEGLVKKGSLTQEKMNKTLSLLKGALDYSEFRNVDMVIEVILATFINSCCASDNAAWS